MALQILEEKGTFQLHGSLTSATTKSFINHFELIIKSMNDVTINIDQIDAIDSNGVSALTSLMHFARGTNTIFSIIGNGCKDIYHEFKSSLAA